MPLLTPRYAGLRALPMAADEPASAGAAADPRKDAAIAAAHALAGDEAGSVAFILDCPYSDARGIAAEHVHSREAVERVWQAMRNADRRVAKLMQARLDEFKRSELALRQAQQCIATAERLLETPRLLANEVVDLDHAWQIAGKPADAEVERFQALRARLATRLEHQASLQHDVLEGLQKLRALLDGPFDRAAAQDVHAAVEAALQVQLQDAEAASLPPHLMQDVDAARAAVSARLAQPEADAATAAPADAEAKPAKPAKAPRVDDSAARRAFGDALAGLEKALLEGALHTAVDCDQALRAPEVAALRLNDKQHQQLAAARAELARLQGWARWGGQVSREELLKTAEDLPAQNLAPAELAKKVGALRASWKVLDGSLGAAPRDLWLRFDAACGTAYAPAAAHFKKLAEERTQNQARATALVAELQALGATLAAGESDAPWKKIAHVVDWSRDTWRRTGAMDRKARKQLDAAHAAALAPLESALAARRAEEVRRREKLITEVEGLSPEQRGMLDRLRKLQDQWQEAARALPLERRVEQALWQRFRAACDAHFAARKQAASQADTERRAHLEAREALCATLEAALNGPDAALQKQLREVRDAWARAGEVPRAAEKKIDARYRAALDAAARKLDHARQAAQQASLAALRDKLALVQEAEAAVLAGGTANADGSDTWSRLAPLPADLETALRARFDQALAGGAAHAERLRQNQPALARELLRAELQLGLDSPPELARERLALQVESLKSALKEGQSPSGRASAAPLLALAAVPDTAQARRLNRVLERALRLKGEEGREAREGRDGRDGRNAGARKPAGRPARADQPSAPRRRGPPKP